MALSSVPAKAVECICAAPLPWPVAVTRLALPAPDGWPAGPVTNVAPPSPAGRSAPVASTSSGCQMPGVAGATVVTAACAGAAPIARGSETNATHAAIRRHSSLLRRPMNSIRERCSRFQARASMVNARIPRKCPRQESNLEPSD